MSTLFPVVDKANSQLLTSQLDIVRSLYRLTLITTHSQKKYLKPYNLFQIFVKLHIPVSGEKPKYHN